MANESDDMICSLMGDIERLTLEREAYRKQAEGLSKELYEAKLSIEVQQMICPNCFEDLKVAHSCAKPDANPANLGRIYEEMQRLHLQLGEARKEIERIVTEWKHEKEQTDRLLGEVYGTLDSIIHAVKVGESARAWIPALMEQLKPFVVKR